MGAPLIWTFKIENAGEVSRQLQQVGQSVRGVRSDTVEYSRDLRRQARDAGAVINQDLYRSRILMAQHPILRQVTQSAQMMSSVLRTATAVQTMLNTAMLLSQGASAQQIANNDELARETAKLNDMKAQGLLDTIAGQEQQEKVNSLQAQHNELTKEASAAQVNLGISFGIAGAQIATQLATMIPRMIAIAAGSVVMGVTYSGALAGMSTATTVFGITSKAVMAASPWLALAAVIGLVAYYVITHWDEVVAFFNTYLMPAFSAVGAFFKQIADFIVANWQTLFVVLTGGVGALALYMVAHWDEIVSGLTNAWTQLKAGFVGLWNAFATIGNAGINGILKGVEFFVNGAISALNVLIRAYNAAVAIVGGKGLSLIPKITLGSFVIPTIKAAAGVDTLVSSPTAFIAGEGGQTERVRVGAPNIGGGSGRTVNVFVTVQGNVWAERDLTDAVKRKIEEGLIDRGF
jgi:hypothetical protein